MLKLRLCDYIDRWNLETNTAIIVVAWSNISKKVKLKKCASFTECIREINNTQVDNAKDFDLVIPMYPLKEYSDKCYWI